MNSCYILLLAKMEQKKYKKHISKWLLEKMVFVYNFVPYHDSKKKVSRKKRTITHDSVYFSFVFELKLFAHGTISVKTI